MSTFSEKTVQKHYVGAQDLLELSYELEKSLGDVLEAIVRSDSACGVILTVLLDRNDDERI